MSRVLILFLLPLLVSGCAPAYEACPVNVSLGSADLPCDCLGEDVEILPLDGSVCFCEEEGYSCYIP